MRNLGAAAMTSRGESIGEAEARKKLLAKDCVTFQLTGLILAKRLVLAHCYT